VPPALLVEELVGRAAGQQRLHDLGEQHRLQLRLRILRFGQPTFHTPNYTR